MQGSLCEYSSIDVHNHYLLQKCISKNIVGIVVEMRTTDEAWNVFQLTNIGQERIFQCSKDENLPHVQHPLCDNEPLKNLYESCKYLITLTESRPAMKIESIDFRSEKSKHQRHYVNHPRNQCENPKCRKVVKKSLLGHISQSQDCLVFYGPRFEELRHEKRLETKRKTFKKIYERHPEAEKERSKEKYK